MEVNGSKVKFTAAYDTIITLHKDIPGTVAKVSAILYENEINIAFMNLERSQRGKNATMTFEVDSKVDLNLVKALKKIEGIEKVIIIDKV